MSENVRKKIEDLVIDTIARLLYYDRKECSILGVGEIEKSIMDGIITIDEIAEIVKSELKKSLE